MKYKILSLLTIFLMTGCGVKNINSTFSDVEQKGAQSDKLLNDMRKADANFILHTDRIFIDKKPLPVVVEKVKPPRSLQCGITLSIDDVDILEFSQLISKICGVRVDVTPDAIKLTNGVIDASSNNNNSQSPPSMDMPFSNRNDQGNKPEPKKITLRHKGALRNLLNTATAGLNLSWKYDEAGNITIFYLDTQTFSLLAMPSSTETESMIQTGGENDSNSGDSSSKSGSGSHSVQKTSVIMKNDLLNDIERNLKTYLTPSVGRLSVSASTGKITVTDTPAVLKKIKDYIDSENKIITQQIFFDVKILSVAINDKDNLGLDWNIVFKSLSERWGGGFKNNLSVANNLTSGSISIFNPKSGFSDSNLLIQALSEQGRVSVVTNPSVVTLNLQPAPIQVGRQTSYLAESSVTNTKDVGTEFTLIPASITTGFNMSLLPHIIPNSSELLVQYNVNLSSLSRLRTISSDKTSIEVPEIENRIFSQRVRIKSGETIILSGFEQISDSALKSGVGHADNIIMGGNRNRNSQRDVIVMMITPTIMK